MSDPSSNYESRLRSELDQFEAQVEVHELPAIFDYWSNSKVRPKFEALGFSSPREMFKLYVERQSTRQSSRQMRLISLGAGNCDLEIELAQHLESIGYSNFVIDCLELNSSMLERGCEAARVAGVSTHLTFLEDDFNHWEPKHEYDAVLALQTLHHVINLERLFENVLKCLAPQGRFIISDMVGCNGHKRWPEALEIVQKLWRELPQPYRFNRMLQRYDEDFVNWDYSLEGFEGIRSQDILPLLLKYFHFEVFVAYGNVIDPFVDRVFGVNFDPTIQWDRDFIDKVHLIDEEAMLTGRIKPTHMEAVLCKSPNGQLIHNEPFTPEFCVRWPSLAPADSNSPIAELARLRNENAILQQRLDMVESKLRMAASSRWLKLGRRLGYGPKLT